MRYSFEVGLSMLTIVLSLILVGWESLGFWAILLITVMQMIVTYLLPKYWVGWKKRVKQGILSTLGLAGIFTAAQMVPGAPLHMLLAIFIQTSAYIIVT